MGVADLMDLSGGPALAVMEAVAEARRRLAGQWLTLPPDAVQLHWTTELGQLHRLLNQTGVRDQLAAEADGPILRRLAQLLSQPRATEIGILLAAMLFAYPHQLPCFFPPEQVPDWLSDAYLTFMQTPPQLFRSAGEAEVYARFLGAWLKCLHERIAALPSNSAWQKIAVSAARSTSAVMAYFSSGNLRELMSLRARILEQAMGGLGNALDFRFGLRPARPKIRLGILAAHFTPQTETFATLPVYRHLDRSKFEVVLLTLQSTGHPLEQLCRSLADSFVQLPRQLAQQVQTIRNADLDILFLGTNVTAVTNGVTLLALHRLARMQVAGVCSCVTTGMRNVDCYLSGRLSEPAAAQDHYTEKLLMVDGPAHCYEFDADTAPPPAAGLTRSDLGLDADCVVFASGANFYKILPEHDEVWGRILAAVPGSRLMLYPFNPNWADVYPERPFIQRMCGALARYGVAADRLLIFNRAPSRAHIFQRLKLADIYLDSYPFAGATSLLEPLALGLPIIEMDGNNFRSLVGAALLRELKLDDFVVKTPQEYIELAVKLARDRGLRASARERVVQAMAKGPRFLDSRAYAAQVGTVLLREWEGLGAEGKM